MHARTTRIRSLISRSPILLTCVPVCRSRESFKQLRTGWDTGKQGFVLHVLTCCVRTPRRFSSTTHQEPCKTYRHSYAWPSCKGTRCSLYSTRWGHEWGHLTGNLNRAGVKPPGPLGSSSVSIRINLEASFASEWPSCRARRLSTFASDTASLISMVLAEKAVLATRMELPNLKRHAASLVTGLQVGGPGKSIPSPRLGGGPQAVYRQT